MNIYKELTTDIRGFTSEPSLGDPHGFRPNKESVPPPRLSLNEVTSRAGPDRSVPLLRPPSYFTTEMCERYCSYLLILCGAVSGYRCISEYFTVQLFTYVHVGIKPRNSTFLSTALPTELVRHLLHATFTF